MKQFKIAFAVLGILCGFTLNGCLNGGEGSGASAGGASSSNVGSVSVAPKSQIPGTISNALNSSSKDTNPGFTSFALWKANDDLSTAVAGEIIENPNTGNTVTLQLPEDTPKDAAIPFTLTFTGVADTVLKDGLQVYSNSAILVTPQSSAKFTVTKSGISKDYTVLFVLEPYFKTYKDPSNQCIQDSDGNVWVKSSPEWGALKDTWPGDMFRITGDGSTNGFSACNIPAGKWGLPSLKQVKALLDKLPLAYRPTPDGRGNLEPTDWFNMPQHGFQLTPGWNYWTSQKDKKISGNAHVMSISKQKTGVDSAPQSSQMYPLPVSIGTESSTKTITSFIFTPENSTPLEGKIVGNQIIIALPEWINPGTPINSNSNASTTGGVVSSNGTQISNSNSLVYKIAQPIPITVTAKNGDKNIYTLIIKNTGVMPPVIKPNIPGLITVCTSSSTVDPAKAFNRIIIATLGTNFYKQDILPLPGTCKEIDLGKGIKDLTANNVLWWSFTNENPIGLTPYVDKSGYYHDIIPKFLWIPADPHKPDPSGFWLTVTMDPSCHHDSQYPLGVTPSCTN